MSLLLLNYFRGFLHSVSGMDPVHCICILMCIYYCYVFGETFIKYLYLYLSLKALSHCFFCSPAWMIFPFYYIYCLLKPHEKKIDWKAISFRLRIWIRHGLRLSSTYSISFTVYIADLGGYKIPTLLCWCESVLNAWNYGILLCPIR